MYNGHPNWTAWNVSLWISNDLGLYNEALHFCRRMNRREAAEAMLQSLHDCNITHTPDGAKYTVTSLRHAFVGL